MTIAPDDEHVDCWKCDGAGRLGGCFEDCCVCGAEDDPELCCSPRRCDVCNGKGHYPRPEGYEE